MTKNQSMRKTYAYRNRNVHSVIDFAGPNGYRQIPQGVVASLVVTMVQSDRIHAIYFTDGSQLHIGHKGDINDRRVIYSHEGKAYKEKLEWTATSNWRKRLPKTQAVEAVAKDEPLTADMARVLTCQALEAKVKGLEKQLAELSEKHKNQAVVIARMQEAARVSAISREKGKNQLKLVEKIANDRALVIQQLTAAHHFQTHSRAGLASVLMRLTHDSAIRPLLCRLAPQGSTMTYNDIVELDVRVHGTQARDSAKLFEEALGDSKKNGCTAMQVKLDELEKKTPKAERPTVNAPWSSPEYHADGWKRHPHSSDIYVYKLGSVLTMDQYRERFGTDFVG